jgi:Na+(H+)/acetate symporter ActP
LVTVVTNDFVPLWRKQAASVYGARCLTLIFGTMVSVLACFGGQFGNILEASAHIISLFAGSITGVFLLGMLNRRANAQGAFWGMLAGMAASLIVNFGTPVSFLWLSPISASVTIGIGYVISLGSPQSPEARSDELTFNASRVISRTK